ncbi:hypothetical protein QBC37DRAFT_400366 [Rhypophila decipiens]|uniref:Uncharacterized protein n=1 Tax=Rhypophila decipiens TaxID=261697 RepID=A0AAN7B804_9PEZI|nr:hypothetical protein QBC37DRAFT_400366 [Rhypophila decipiens]
MSGKDRVPNRGGSQVVRVCTRTRWLCLPFPSWTTNKLITIPSTTVSNTPSHDVVIPGGGFVQVLEPRCERSFERGLDLLNAFRYNCTNRFVYGVAVRRDALAVSHMAELRVGVLLNGDSNTVDALAASVQRSVSWLSPMYPTVMARPRRRRDEIEDSEDEHREPEPVTQRSWKRPRRQLDSFGSSHATGVNTIPATQPQVGQPAPQLLGDQTSSTLVPSTNPQDTLGLVNRQQTRISSDHDPGGSDPSGSDPSGSEDEEEPGPSTKPKPKATPKPKTKTKKRGRVVERSKSADTSTTFSVDGMKKDMISAVQATERCPPVVDSMELFKRLIPLQPVSATWTAKDRTKTLNSWLNGSQRARYQQKIEKHQPLLTLYKLSIRTWRVSQKVLYPCIITSSIKSHAKLTSRASVKGSVLTSCLSLTGLVHFANSWAVSCHIRCGCVHPNCWQQRSDTWTSSTPMTVGLGLWTLQRELLLSTTRHQENARRMNPYEPYNVSIIHLEILIEALDTMTDLGFPCFTAVELTSRALSGARPATDFPLKAQFEAVRDHVLLREEELKVIRRRAAGLPDLSPPPPPPAPGSDRRRSARVAPPGTEEEAVNAETSVLVQPGAAEQHNSPSPPPDLEDEELAGPLSDSEDEELAGPLSDSEDEEPELPKLPAFIKHGVGTAPGDHPSHSSSDEWDGFDDDPIAEQDDPITEQYDNVTEQMTLWLTKITMSLSQPALSSETPRHLRQNAKRRLGRGPGQRGQRMPVFSKTKVDWSHSEPGRHLMLFYGLRLVTKVMREWSWNRLLGQRSERRARMNSLH